MDVVAGDQFAGQIWGARGVVVAVAVTGAANPAVFHRVGVQGTEGVEQAAVIGELPVEVVLERREERVVRQRRRELLDSGDGGVETRPVTAELAVRFGPKPVQRHVAVDPADLGELGDLVVCQGGDVGADPDAHPGIAEGAHDVQKLWMDGELAAGQRHPIHPADRQSRNDRGGDVVASHRIDTLNRVFHQVCGEVLVVKQGRGQDYLFTPTGEAVADIAAKSFADWLAGITDRRRKLGATLAVATTEFTVDFLTQVWPDVAEEFTRREIQLNIAHVRTRDFWTQLDAKNVDLVCGSVAAAPGDDPALADYDVIEWHREDLALLTNLSTRELPMAAAAQDRLPEVPPLAPSAGLVAEFLRRWYGPGFQSELTIVAEVDSIYYGLALLRSRLVHGALICARAVAEAAVEGRLVPLADDYDPALQLLAGIFARKGERQLYDHTHPLNLLWDAFAAHAQNRSP